ncbi:hypothetical protein [Vibrio hyugaensis]|uniref:hypothetical protein n=1 Tax=Vibrio hyugaensis TaxID=1534743 RepID=UPI0011AFE781|nr:hypothetical protein [Vibrio hyugaensis]
MREIKITSAYVEHDFINSGDNAICATIVRNGRSVDVLEWINCDKHGYWAIENVDTHIDCNQRGEVEDLFTEAELELLEDRGECVFDGIWMLLQEELDHTLNKG